MKPTGLNRRGFLAACTRAGIAGPLLPGILFALAAAAEEKNPAEPLAKITAEMLDCAAELAGVGPFTAEQKTMMLDGLSDQRAGYAAIRAFHLPNDMPPAFVFHPQTAVPPHPAGACHVPTPTPTPDEQIITIVDDGGYGHRPIPANLEEMAFWSALELGKAVQSGKVQSLDLTKMYIARLKRLDPQLHCVITLLEERALAQARQADEEIAAGKWRGPLHGVPWGAKDLLAVKGAPTTWGAGGFEQQRFDADATVVARLDAAGAVLVAKLSLGALAMGDKWFGGRTRNPWNMKQGSSGSSAGSAAAVAAGCVGFAIGSETLGSISSPSTRCGTTGLRPSFGMVPRTGAMALSWTMDKLGPIARSAEDCALILAAICGPDGKDTAASGEPFAPLASIELAHLRIGYLQSEFNPPPPPKLEEEAENESAMARRLREARNKAAQQAHARRVYDRRYDLAALSQLRTMGATLLPVELPKLPWTAMTPLLSAEAAAAFDELTTSGRDALLTEQGPEDWPNDFRMARLYPAVEYIQANRLRTLAIRQMNALFEQVDLIVTPSTDAQLMATNLTGHPALIVPNGLRGADAPPAAEFDDGNHDDIGGPGTPVSLTFLAGLYRDALLAAFGRAYQQTTSFHKQHPPMA